MKLSEKSYAASNGGAVPRREAELRAFLRAMRARLEPADVGLPARERRRKTPGLRIEEAAALAGVSLTWYRALEDGKGTKLSANSLDRVAVALLLTSEQRETLHALARPPASGDSAAIADEALRSIVDGFTAGPAIVFDTRWTVLASNRCAAIVYDLVPGRDPNMLRRMFLDPAYRELHAEWPRVAREMVDILHMSFGRMPEDPETVALVDQLRAASAEFARLWDDFGLSRFPPTSAVLNHPALGRLALTYAGFVATALRFETGRFVVVFQPAADRATARRLASLAERRANLTSFTAREASRRSPA